MTIDVYPPTNATQSEWRQVVDCNDAPRTATSAPEAVTVRVHLPSGETVQIVVPERR